MKIVLIFLASLILVTVLLFFNSLLRGIRKVLGAGRTKEWDDRV